MNLERKTGCENDKVEKEKRIKYNKRKIENERKIPKTLRHKQIAMKSIILNGQQETKVINQ